MKRINDLIKSLKQQTANQYEQAQLAAIKSLGWRVGDPLLPEKENPALDAAKALVTTTMQAVTHSQNFEDPTEKQTAITKLKDALKTAIMSEEKGRVAVANNNEAKCMEYAGSYMKVNLNEFSNNHWKTAAKTAFDELHAEHEAKHGPPKPF